MKKIHAFIIIVLFCFEGKAQIVNIPDVNFKNKLLNYSPAIDTNTDGEIQVNEALAVSELYLNDSDISDLTGVEAFANLNFLSCSENNLSHLQVNNLINLTVLACNYNNLSSLDVSNLTQLSYLGFISNSIMSIDVVDLPNLSWLDCSFNQLTDLDLSNSTQLNRVYADHNLFTTLDFSHFIPTAERPATYYRLSNNPNLVSINIKNGAPIMTMAPGAVVFPFTADYCGQLVNICADDFNLGILSLYTNFNPNITFTSDCVLTKNNFEDKNVMIYPNPAKDKLNITAKQNITSVQLYDIQGRLVETTHASGKNAILNLAKNANGIYFVRFIPKKA